MDERIWEVMSYFFRDDEGDTTIKKVKYTTDNPVWIEALLNDTRLPRSFFKNKFVCDVGCGIGRNSYAMSELGAKVIALDFVDSNCRVTYENLKKRGVNVIKADLHHLPFKDETFDFVISWGFLHHTPSTKVAFDCVSKIVKNAELSGCIYMNVVTPFEGLM